MLARLAAACQDLVSLDQGRGRALQLSDTLSALKDALTASGEHAEMCKQIALSQLDWHGLAISKQVGASPASSALAAQLQAISDALAELHRSSAQPALLRVFALAARMAIGVVSSERAFQLVSQAAKLLEQTAAVDAEDEFARACSPAPPSTHSSRVSVTMWPPQGGARKYMRDKTSMMLASMRQMSTSDKPAAQSCSNLMEEAAQAMDAFVNRQPGLRCSCCNKPASANVMLRNCKRCSGVSYCGRYVPSSAVVPMATEKRAT